MKKIRIRDRDGRWLHSNRDTNLPEWRESSGSGGWFEAYEEGDAIPQPPPQPEPPPTAPELPALTVKHKQMWRGDHPFDWREASQFTMLARMLKGERGRVDDDLGWWKANGATALRVLCRLAHPWWAQKGWAFDSTHPKFQERLDDLCHLFRQHGLYLRATACADMQHGGVDKVAHCQQVNGVIRFHNHILGEIANEPSINGFPQGDPRELADLAAIFDSNLVALGAEHGARGHLLTYDTPPADYVTFHAERVRWENGWAWVRRLGEYAVAKEGERPALSGEPINAGDEGNPNDFEPDPAIWFCYGALSRIVPSHGYAPCFHYHRGLFAERPTGRTLDCWKAFNDGCDAVPMSARMQPWTNGHHDGSPWRGFWQTHPPSNDKPSRIYGRCTGANYWGVTIREPAIWVHSDKRYGVQPVAEQRGNESGFGCSVWRGV